MAFIGWTPEGFQGGLTGLQPGMQGLFQGMANRMSPEARQARNIMSDPNRNFNTLTGDWGAGTSWYVKQKYKDQIWRNPNNFQDYMYGPVAPSDEYEQYTAGSGATWSPKIIEIYNRLQEEIAKERQTKETPGMQQGGRVVKKMQQGGAIPKKKGHMGELADLIQVERKLKGPDSQLIAAQPGEYVLSKPAVDMLGGANLDMINEMAKGIPKMEPGGPVGFQDQMLSRNYWNPMSTYPAPSGTPPNPPSGIGPGEKEKFQAELNALIYSQQHDLTGEQKGRNPEEVAATNLQKFESDQKDYLVKNRAAILRVMAKEARGESLNQDEIATSYQVQRLGLRLLLNKESDTVLPGRVAGEGSGIVPVVGQSPAMGGAAPYLGPLNVESAIVEEQVKPGPVEPAPPIAPPEPQPQGPAEPIPQTMSIGPRGPMAGMNIPWDQVLQGDPAQAMNILQGFANTQGQMNNFYDQPGPTKQDLFGQLTDRYKTAMAAEKGTLEIDTFLEKHEADINLSKARKSNLVTETKYLEKRIDAIGQVPGSVLPGTDRWKVLADTYDKLSDNLFQIAKGSGKDALWKGFWSTQLTYMFIVDPSSMDKTMEEIIDIARKGKGLAKVVIDKKTIEDSMIAARAALMGSPNTNFNMQYNIGNTRQGEK